MLRLEGPEAEWQNVKRLELVSHVGKTVFHQDDAFVTCSSSYLPTMLWTSVTMTMPVQRDPLAAHRARSQSSSPLLHPSLPVPPIAGVSRDVPASGVRRSRRTAAAARAGVSAPVYNEDERSAHIVAEIELNKRG